MAKKNIAGVDVSGKRVLMRVDFNVPLDKESGEVTNDARILAALPTIQNVLQRGGRLILMSHLGRPEGKGFEASMSLTPAAARLGELLGKTVPVPRGPDEAPTLGPAVTEAVEALAPGECLCLENLRFQRAETLIDKAKKNPDGKLTADQEAERQRFAEGLAALADVYCNDAFGTCHRNHVSMYSVPNLLKGEGKPCVCGFLIEKELKYLGEALADPKRPFIAILGGAKVSDKVKVIKFLLGKADIIIIGGAMCYPFMKAKGRNVGNSKLDPDDVSVAGDLLKDIEKASCKVLFPVDHVDAKELAANVETQVSSGEIPDGFMGLDIGPQTTKMYCDCVLGGKTVVWNGPMGVFETPPFDKGTKHLAQAVAATKAVTIIGGGDSAAAVEAAHLTDHMSHVSTGGGASLKFIEKRRFDTLDLLDDV